MQSAPLSLIRLLLRSRDRLDACLGVGEEELCVAHHAPRLDLLGHEEGEAVLGLVVGGQLQVQHPQVDHWGGAVLI